MVYDKIKNAMNSSFQFVFNLFLQFYQNILFVTLKICPIFD
jgi:hypothetical protein